MVLFLMCIKIFFARILDVSLGTIRTAVSMKGKTISSALIAFVEVTIWFLVAKEALNTTGINFFIVISYSAGYAVGTMIGTYISKTFLRGLIRIEVITSKATDDNIDLIKSNGYGVSIIELKNTNQDLLLIETKNKEVKKVRELINSFDKNAFIVINDTRVIYNGFIK
ncbi:MAG: DUF5698 domain-containing protein [Bacilli bacterium]